MIPWGLFIRFRGRVVNDVTRSPLEDLQDQLLTLPPGSTKHDMRLGFDVMASWIRSLPDDRREKVREELPDWLKDATHPWHSRAAMEVALRLQDKELLNAAIREARNRGVDELTGGEEYPAWLIFHLDLLSTISRWPDNIGDDAREYLRDLRLGAFGGSTYPRRLLKIRSWFTECLLGPPDGQRPCLGEALDVLRGWRDPRLVRSGLTLLHAYFAATPRGKDLLRELLTRQEFGTVMHEQAAE